MQAVILAAGRGTQMGICERPPKMLEVAGKTLLEHKFDVLPENVGGSFLLVICRTSSRTLGNSYNGKENFA